MDSLLQIQDLSVRFNTPEGPARAVDRVSFDLARGETLGLVGESGCGKSVTALSILGLIPDPPGKIEQGKILFSGKDLVTLDQDRLRRIRGNRISMIFQEPMTSLNPVLTIGRQVMEPLLTHKGLSRSEAEEEAVRWLKRVKIPGAESHLRSYPHQLSGGMRQRIMIAMAMAVRPEILLADEPTTALDVTIQAQILSLMLELKKESNSSLLLITHDMGVVAQMVSRVVVMYAGQVVEQARTEALFQNPGHPYTRGLLKSMPRLKRQKKREKIRLEEIPGTVPRLTEQIAGCKFFERCPCAFDRCRESRPGLRKVQSDHFARCWLVETS
ncbi:MAG: ABC transporter ATP-binding protein [Desulfohalobiaceae bacterium]|nr:ABC transporter ATP-binding protein [Desulfohalobiaceae bacterium]